MARDSSKPMTETEYGLDILAAAGYDEDGRPMYRNTADGPQCTRCGEMNGEHEDGCANAE